jgi:hypothetical protein
VHSLGAQAVLTKTGDHNEDAAVRGRSISAASNSGAKADIAEGQLRANSGNFPTRLALGLECNAACSVSKTSCIGAALDTSDLGVLIL